MSYLGQQLGQGQAERFVYTASGGETSVTTSDDGRAIAYTVGQVDVYLNGAKLINGSDFTATTGTSITGLSALTASDVVEVFALSIFQASDTVSASTGGTFNGNITIDADLTIKDSGQATAIFERTSSSFPNVLVDVTSTSGATTYYSGAMSHFNGEWRILTQATSTTRNPLARIIVGSGGDVSFRDDTGVFDRFYWDASFERLGLGTSTPDTALHIAASVATITLEDIDTNAESSIVGGSSGNLLFRADPLNAVSGSYIGFAVDSFTDAMRLDSSGNVGINTDSPGGKLSVRGTSGLGISDSHLAFGANQDAYITTGASGIVVFREHDGVSTNTERMRIDSSGNLLVGKNFSDTSLAGHELRPGSFAAHTVNGDVVLNLRRLSSDGDIARFQKDGTTVGSIGTVVAGAANQLYINSDDVGLRFRGSDDSIVPCTSAGTFRDAAIDLGLSSGRFKDLYLSGGVYLGGTGTANKLDDYEEGTFTVTLRGSASEPGTLITSTGNQYVKIGKTVYIQIQFEGIDTTGYSGDITFTGLPFAQTINRRRLVLFGGYNGATWSSGHIPVAVINSNATSIVIQSLRSAATWTATQHNANSSVFLWIMGTYDTAA